jgi:hypothetical protein
METSCRYLIVSITDGRERKKKRRRIAWSMADDEHRMQELTAAHLRH